MSARLLQHLRSLADALARLSRSPVASLMTFTVIAIALALPATVFLLADNLQTIVSKFSHTAQLSVFIKAERDAGAARAVQKQIEAIAQVESVDYVSATQALAEFRELSGLGESLDRLPENPLPETLIVVPRSAVVEAGRVPSLAQRIRALADVDQVIVDTRWLARLRTLIQIAKRIGVALTLLMALGVVMVIGNTVRLSVLNRSDEIEIIDLVGGTAAFIRRPFLYSGFAQGALGGALAWILVWVIMRLLAGQVEQLAAQYGSGFTLASPGWLALSLLVSTAGGLGWLAARLAVEYQLNQRSYRRHN